MGKSITQVFTANHKSSLSGNEQIPGYDPDAAETSVDTAFTVDDIRRINETANGFVALGNDFRKYSDNDTNGIMSDTTKIFELKHKDTFVKVTSADCTTVEGNYVFVIGIDGNDYHNESIFIFEHGMQPMVLVADYQDATTHNYITPDYYVIGEVPTTESGKKYILSIKDNIAIFGEYELPTTTATTSEE